MIEVSCLCTGSSGNCYFVRFNKSNLLLDCGVNLAKLNKYVNLNSLDFCFISHDHKDHSMLREKLKFRGVAIIEGKDYVEPVKINFTGPRKLDYKIYLTPLEHGTATNSALILEGVNDCLLYATDFSVCRYNLKQFKFTKIMVECNFLESLIEGVNDSKIKAKITRQINTHLGLDGTILFLEKLDLSKCKEIILLHTSESFGDTTIMGATIYKKYNIKTKVCLKNGGFEIYG